MAKKKPLFKIVPGSIVDASGNGYKYCVTDPPHPHGMELKDRKLKYIYHHVALMELKLGRYLRKDEEVHHKDGNQANNALSNLELFKKKGEHQKEHALTDNPFWKKSPENKPDKKAALRVVTRFKALEVAA
jgi:hypothetical protein